MKPAAKRLIRLGQSIAEKYQLGRDVPSTTDHWINALSDDGYGSEEKSEDEE